jgi:hypothetical protein
MNADLLLKSPIAKQIPHDLHAHLKEVAYSKKENREFPKWYKFKMPPLPDQRRAIDKLYPRPAGALLMPMGVGKSKTAIDLVTAHFMERRIDVVIIAAPLTTLGVWTGVDGQLDKHSPLPFRAVHADSTFDWTKHRPKADEVLWVTVGLESLSAGGTLKKLLPMTQHYKYAMIVDESHYIKNHDKNRTKAAKELRQKAQFAYIMTGTVATRNMIDMFSQYEFLDPNIIGVGDYYAFRNRYCVMGGYKRKEIVGYDKVEELMGLIEPYTYICDVPEGLPPQVWTKRQVRMHPEQYEMYMKVKRAEVPEVSVKHVLTKVLRLAQIVGGFLYEDAKEVIDPISGKVKKIPGKLLWQLPPDKNPKMVDVLEQIEQEPDRQFIIWSGKIFEIEMIAAALEKMGPTAKLIGATENRAEVVRDFEAGKIQYLVANPQIGGLSWTLIAATRGYYFSNTDKLDDRLQSEKRIHRQGQDQAVLYTDWEMLTPKGGATTDTLQLAALREKMDLDVYIKQKIKEAGFKIEDLF